MKLLIGIPTGGQPTQPFLDAVPHLALPPGALADRLIWSGNSVAVQREMIARHAVASGADILLMIDDDVVPPPDALIALVRALENDARAAVAGALYYSRDGARPMAVARWSSTDTTEGAIPAFRNGEVTDVDGVGFGCVALRVSALRAFSTPYFAAHVFVNEATRSVRQADEDYLYCERVRTAGWRVLLHAGVRAGHYDRATNRLSPERWEDDVQTDRLRMIVRDADGRTRMIPYDAAHPRADERQEPFPLTLLFGA
ncbi:MAG TPA: glycosyltransferase [Candidatus Sulfotelmatobacter sp.]|nr:glycosyltransferase [Candidatus Sulfotelmatobacter sp.]